MRKLNLTGLAAIDGVRLVHLANGHLPETESEKRLVALAQIGDPVAWQFTSRASQRHRALKTTQNILRHQDAARAMEAALRERQESWLSRILRPFKLAEA